MPPTLLFLLQKIAGKSSTCVHGVYFGYYVFQQHSMLSMVLQPKKNMVHSWISWYICESLTTPSPSTTPPPPERRRTTNDETTVIKAIPLNVFDPPETEFSVVANWYLGFLWLLSVVTWEDGVGLGVENICFFVRRIVPDVMRRCWNHMKYIFWSILYHSWWFFLLLTFLEVIEWLIYIDLW